MNIVIGTAGHIDHGKTALVRALTGVDADRLPEEKRRGITIDLGFAELDLGDLKFAFVDVPGHEKFVKNMLAGAHGIHLVMLVVAADEGVMPQTREHFEICRLLEIKSGLVVLTKVDLVDDELLELVKLDVAELVQNSFLETAPIVSVSAKTNVGIENLKETLRNLALTIPARENETVARLPIDRVFSVKGFGAVVTGTLVAGEISEGDELELLPVGKKIRVRGVQTGGKTVSVARAGQRTAVNLGGVETAEIERGMMLAQSDSLRPTQNFEAQIEVLPDAPRALRSRQRVRVHLGTIEALARVHVLEENGEIAAGETGFAQLRFETLVVAVPHTRFIIRSYSPQRTIAGGKILDSFAARVRRKDFGAAKKRLEKLLAADKDKSTQLRLLLETAAERGLTSSDLKARTAWRDDILHNVLTELTKKKAVVVAENVFISRTAFERLAEKIVAAIQSYHQSEPLARGIKRETLREQVFSKLPQITFRTVLAELEQREQVIAEKDVVRAVSHSRDLSPSDKMLLEQLKKIYVDAGLEVPTLENALAEVVSNTKTTKEKARKVFQLLLDSGELVSITPEFYVRRELLTKLLEKLREQIATNASDGLFDVAQFKDLAGISRKYAIPLLEYLDREKLTRRVGDKRLILF